MAPKALETSAASCTDERDPTMVCCHAVGTCGSLAVVRTWLSTVTLTRPVSDAAFVTPTATAWSWAV